MPSATIDYEKAAILRSQGLSYREIGASLGVNPASLKVGMSRKGIARLVNKNRENAVTRAESVLQTMSSRSEAIRGDFAEALSSHVQALKEVPAMADLKHLKQVGEAIEPLARTARAVFDWDSTHAPGLVIVGLTEQFDEDATPVDV